jgi:hypothetical protein
MDLHAVSTTAFENQPSFPDMRIVSVHLFACLSTEEQPGWARVGKLYLVVHLAMPRMKAGLKFNYFGSEPLNIRLQA